MSESNCIGVVNICGCSKNIEFQMSFINDIWEIMWEVCSNKLCKKYTYTQKYIPTPNLFNTLLDDVDAYSSRKTRRTTIKQPPTRVRQWLNFSSYTLRMVKCVTEGVIQSCGT